MAEENKKPEEKKTETKTAEAKIEKKKAKKNDAVVNGKNISAGIKHSVAICNFIRRKEIDEAITMLEEVLVFRRAVPMRGEIPHRKGKMMSGRYPIKAAGIFLKLLKSLKSNATQNELELEKFRIFAMANVASRPYRRFGQGRFKRSHVTIKLIPIIKEKKQ